MSSHSDIEESGHSSVDELRARIPEDRAVEDLADVFSLLGDPGRLRLLLALGDGEVRVGDLSRATGRSDSGVSHALQLLRAHRIVAVRREGRRAFYRLDDPHVQGLLELALDHTRHSALEHPERLEVPARGPAATSGTS